MPMLLGFTSLAVFGSWVWLFPDLGLNWFQFISWAVLSLGSAAIGIVYGFSLSKAIFLASRRDCYPGHMAMYFCRPFGWRLGTIFSLCVGAAKTSTDGS